MADPVLLDNVSELRTLVTYICSYCQLLVDALPDRADFATRREADRLCGLTDGLRSFIEVYLSLCDPADYRPISARYTPGEALRAGIEAGYALENELCSALILFRNWNQRSLSPDEESYPLFIGILDRTNQEIRWIAEHLRKRMVEQPDEFDSGVTASIQGLLAGLHQAVAGLADLVADQNLVYGLRTGRIKLTEEWVYIDTAIAAALDTLSRIAYDWNVTVQHVRAPHLAPVLADSALLAQAIRVTAAQGLTRSLGPGALTVQAEPGSLQARPFVTISFRYRLSARPSPSTLRCRMNTVHLTPSWRAIVEGISALHGGHLVADTSRTGSATRPVFRTDVLWLPASKWPPALQSPSSHHGMAPSTSYASETS